jgi:hypothetical protein
MEGSGRGVSSKHRVEPSNVRRAVTLPDVGLESSGLEA